MFSGIIEKEGRLIDKKKRGSLWRLVIETTVWQGRLALGESVAVNGVCLTVADIRRRSFTADVVPETIASTTIRHWKIGERLNLERSLKLGSRLGGHFVFGHVDVVGEIVRITRRGRNHRLKIRAPADIIRYLVLKGSIAVDGISLTIQQVGRGYFEVAIIPRTASETAIGSKTSGSYVNLEADMLAKELYHFLRKTRSRSRSQSKKEKA